MACCLPPWLHEQQSSGTSTQSASVLQSAVGGADLVPWPRLASAPRVKPSRPTSRESSTTRRRRGVFMGRKVYIAARRRQLCGRSPSMEVPRSLRIWFVVHAAVDLLAALPLLFA